MMSLTKYAIITFSILLSNAKLFSQSDSIDYLGQPAPKYFPEKFASGMFGKNEWGPVFSPNGDEMFFTWQNPNGSQNYQIKHRTKTNGQWSESSVAPFSDPNRRAELEPNFTPDGQRLYFDSERDGGYGGADIWYVTKTDTGWSQPVNAGPEINTSSNDNFPSFAEDGSMFFCSDRLKGNWDIDIYYAKYENGTFLAPQILGDSINTDKWEACPTAYKNKLVFESTRPDGYGKGDVCISQITEGKFGKAQTLSPAFNTYQSEYGIVLSPDKKYLFFKRSDETDILWVDAEILDFQGPKEPVFHYVASWYTGNKDQMALALHPKLAKRQVQSADRIGSVTYDWMLNATDNCFRCIDNYKEEKKEVTILDETGNMATAKAISKEYYDFPHMVKFNGYWKILNVVWDYHTINIEGDTASLETAINDYIKGYKNSDSAEYANLFHPAYNGRIALSHEDVHSVSKTQFMKLQSACSSCSFNNDFTADILAMHKNIASVKIQKGDSLEYLHFSFQGDRWYLINALRNFRFDPERNYNPEDVRIKLTSKEIMKGQAIGTEIGEFYLQGISQGNGNTFEFSLEAPAETNQNEWFILEDGKLKSNKFFEPQDTNLCTVSIKAVVNAKDTVQNRITIQIKSGSTTDIKKNELAVVYPNPSKGIVIIRMQGNEPINSLTISDMKGKTVFRKTGIRSSETELDLSELPRGSYSVKTGNEARQATKNIILQ